MPLTLIVLQSLIILQSYTKAQGKTMFFFNETHVMHWTLKVIWVPKSKEWKKIILHFEGNQIKKRTWALSSLNGRCLQS
jgi:hypothetical protein